MLDALLDSAVGKDADNVGTHNDSMIVARVFYSSREHAVITITIQCVELLLCDAIVDGIHDLNDDLE